MSKKALLTLCLIIATFIVITGTSCEQMLSEKIFTPSYQELTTPEALKFFYKNFEEFAKNNPDRDTLITLAFKEKIPASKVIEIMNKHPKIKVDEILSEDAGSGTPSEEESLKDFLAHNYEWALEITTKWADEEEAYCTSTSTAKFQKNLTPDTCNPETMHRARNQAIHLKNRKEITISALRVNAPAKILYNFILDTPEIFSVVRGRPPIPLYPGTNMKEWN